jgi:K+-sensing histidine kinase KdpD
MNDVAAFDALIHSHVSLLSGGFFFLVVAAVSRLWGPGPGLFATLLGGLARLGISLLEPQFSFAFSQQRDDITLISYFAVAIAISFLPQASSPLGGRAK